VQGLLALQSSRPVVPRPPLAGGETAARGGFSARHSAGSAAAAAAAGGWQGQGQGQADRAYGQAARWQDRDAAGRSAGATSAATQHRNALAASAELGGGGAAGDSHSVWLREGASDIRGSQHAGGRYETAPPPEEGAGVEGGLASVPAYARLMRSRSAAEMALGSSAEAAAERSEDGRRSGDPSGLTEGSGRGRAVGQTRESGLPASVHHIDPRPATYGAAASPPRRQRSATPSPAHGAAVSAAAAAGRSTPQRPRHLSADSTANPPLQPPTGAEGRPPPAPDSAQAQAGQLFSGVSSRLALLAQQLADERSRRQRVEGTVVELQQQVQSRLHLGQSGPLSGGHGDTAPAMAGDGLAYADPQRQQHHASTASPLAAQLEYALLEA